MKKIFPVIQLGNFNRRINAQGAHFEFRIRCRDAYSRGKVFWLRKGRLFDAKALIRGFLEFFSCTFVTTSLLAIVSYSYFLIGSCHVS